MTQLNRDIQNTQTRLTRSSEDAQLEMQAKNDELLLPIFEKAQAVFQEYANEQQYTLIFNIAVEQSGLIYAAPSVDITNEVIRRMDAAAESSEATSRTSRTSRQPRLRLPIPSTVGRKCVGSPRAAEPCTVPLGPSSEGSCSLWRV